MARIGFEPPAKRACILSQLGGRWLGADERGKATLYSLALAQAERNRVESDDAADTLGAGLHSGSTFEAWG